MERTAASTLLLPDDALREILLRVSTDAAALFRCGTTCKRWRALVADRSFLRRCWPDYAAHSSSLIGLIGFFQKEWDKQQPPFFSPILPGSVLGSHRRSLASLVSGVPAGVLNSAMPIAARRGLLLMRPEHGRLSLLHLRKEGFLLSTWTRVDDGTWLRTGVIELKPLNLAWRHLGCISIWPGKKRNTLLITDLYGRVHEADTETGMMEDVTTKMFQDGVGPMAVPIEIDWPTLFSSRLSS